MSRSPPPQYLLEPDLIILGCQAWPPRAWDDVCPVCGGRIADPSRSVCGWCLGVAPRREGYLAVSRSLAESVDRDRERDQKSRLKLAKIGRTKLTELERRRIWNGYRGSVFAEVVGGVNNLALAGRQWLEQIGQAPDWSIVIEPRTRRYA